MEINITLQPKQKEAFLKSLETPVLFYGGARGGGKSYLIRARELYRRLKYPNTRGLIVRKTYPELLANHIRMFFLEYPDTREWYNKAEKTIYYPNGSTTEFSYLQNTDDVFTYQGREYEDISVDEVTQHEEMVIKILRASNRTTLKDIDPTMMLTGNPGGIGHQWVKRLFVDKEYKENESPEDFDFVQAKVFDNQALMDADPEYVDRLKDNPEHIVKAWLDGDWSIHAGQAFGELSTQKHMVEPFELPPYTRYFAGYDHGFNHPYSFVMFAVVPDGTVYVTKHLTGRLKRPDEIANDIKEATKDEINRAGRVEIYAGADLWARQRDGGPTVFEQFYDAGLREGSGFSLIKAKTDRIQGASQVRKWVSWKNTDTEEPKLYFFENTRDVFNVLTNMQFDDKKPEDVMKMDADLDGLGGDDAYDAFRYGLMSRAIPKKPEETKLPRDTGEGLLREHLERKRMERMLSGW